MKIGELKKFSPYIVVGLVLGVLGLVFKSRSSNNSGSADTSSTTSQAQSAQLDQMQSNMDTQQNNYKAAMDQLNTTLGNQQTYYNSVISDMNTKLQNDTNSIAALTTHQADNEATISALQLENQNLSKQVTDNAGKKTVVWSNGSYVVWSDGTKTNAITPPKVTKPVTK